MADFKSPPPVTIAEQRVGVKSLTASDHGERAERPCIPARGPSPDGPNLYYGAQRSSYVAKHKGKGRKRTYNLRRVPVTPFVALGALVAGIAVKVGLTGTSDAQYRLISASLLWSLHNHTAGEGPISCGYAFGDYTVTEIKEHLEIASAISPGDKIAQEKANRWIRTVGQFSGQDASEQLNDGKPISTRLNWAVQIGETVAVWFYNNDTNDLTTGSVGGVMGNIFVKDY